MSVPRFTASDYLVGTFSLIPLYCLSLDLRLLITSLVHFFLIPFYCLSLDLRLLNTSLVHFFNTIVLSVTRFTASDYIFGTFSLIPLYYLSLDLRLLITSLVLFLLYHCIVCPSIYGFWLPLWSFFVYTIVFSVSRFTASDYLFGTFSLIPLYCLSLDLRLLITSLVIFRWYHCIVCPSIYGFSLPFWYLFFNTIVLSVPRFTASDYLVGTFSLIPLYCLSLDLRLLIISLVLFL